MVICSNCGHENGDGSKFCVECGTKLVALPKFCPECGTKIDGVVKFCPECGFNLVDNNASNENEEKVSKTVYKTENVINNTKFGKYDYIDNELEPYDLDTAIRYGHISVAKRMIEDEGISEITAYSISNAHNAEMINLLASYGCDFNITDDSGDSILMLVIKDYGLKQSDYREHYNETGESSWKPGIFSEGDEFETEDDVHNKYLGIIDALIKNGADPEYINGKVFLDTALTKAASYSLVKLVSYLVEDCKVDVNFVPKPDAEENYEFYKKQIEECELDSTVSLSDCEEITGDSPLICAIAPDYGSSKKDIYSIVKCLLENGADIDFHSVNYDYITSELYTKTPLSTSLSHEESINIDLIKLLIQYGADYSEYDTEDEKLEELFAIQNEDLRNRLFSIFEINDAQERYEEYCNNNEYIAERLAEAWGVDSDDEDSYEDDESVEDRIVSILDEYLPKICKDCIWYTKSGGTFEKSEYRTRIENARSKIVYNRSVSEILGMVDTTIFKNGKSGIVFLTDGISFDYGFSKVTVPYTQMGDMFLDKVLHFQHWIENKNNSAWKGDVTIDGIYYNLSTLKKCLEEIRNVL